MKFYITSEDRLKIANSFINLNVFCIIDVKHIIKTFDLDLSKKTNVFIINSYIEKSITDNAKSKRLQGIIYINPNLCDEILDNVYNMINDNEFINSIVLLDDCYNPKLKHLYKNFEEVLFFPSSRKIKIIECKPFKK